MGQVDCPVGTRREVGCPCCKGARIRFQTPVWPIHPWEHNKLRSQYWYAPSPILFFTAQLLILSKTPQIWKVNDGRFITHFSYLFIFLSFTVTAKYEVILAAGTIATAQLLMLSGIGPKEHLREKGIPLVEDLPVGNHTNDHQEVCYFSFFLFFLVLQIACFGS